MARFVTLLSFVYVVHAFDYNQRCLFFNGKCVAHCPYNMHAYHTRCDGQTMSQRTCESPLVYILGYTCGWSRCDCNGNLMLDEEVGYCVEDKYCQMYPSKAPKLKTATDRRGGRRKYKLSKRIKMDEDELTNLT